MFCGRKSRALNRVQSDNQIKRRSLKNSMVVISLLIANLASTFAFDSYLGQTSDVPIDNDSMNLELASFID